METISDSSGVRGSVESLIGGRQENQDSYGMAETRLGMLVAVCDGMGGGPAGKTASSIATQAIIDYVSGASADGNLAWVLFPATRRYSPPFRTIRPLKAWELPVCAYLS